MAKKQFLKFTPAGRLIGAEVSARGKEDTMPDNKKPGEPVEEERREQEIHLSQLDDRILCQIDETVIQNVKAYSFAQSSNGKALLNLSIEINVEVVSTTIQAQRQSHL